jgi:type III pantothenate kinase
MIAEREPDLTVHGLRLAFERHQSSGHAGAGGQAGGRRP